MFVIDAGFFLVLLCQLEANAAGNVSIQDLLRLWLATEVPCWLGPQTVPTLHSSMDPVATTTACSACGGSGCGSMWVRGPASHSKLWHRSGLYVGCVTGSGMSQATPMGDSGIQIKGNTVAPKQGCQWPQSPKVGVIAC